LGRSENETGGLTESINGQLERPRWEREGSSIVTGKSATKKLLFSGGCGTGFETDGRT